MYWKLENKVLNVPVNIAVELCWGSWGQDPFPENSWLIRNFPSSYSSEACGSLLYPIPDWVSMVFALWDDPFFVESVFDFTSSILLLTFFVV